jgi:ABC-2 type transport system permease protein
MRRFFKLVALSMQSALFYKTAFLINLFTPLVLLLGQFLLWNSLYALQDGAAMGGFSKPDMFSYLLIAFLINNLLTWSSENTLSREIRSGAVTARCIRPVPFFMQSVAGMTGSICPQALVNFTMVGLAFALFWPKLTPPSAAMLGPALASLVLAVLLRMTLVSWFSLLCFYTTGHLGLTWTRTALTEFFSGALIPLSLFPEWLRSVSFCTPFPLMLQTPASLLLGQPLQLPLPATFALQVGWMAFFFILHELLYRRIRRNMVLAGG